MPTNCCSFQEEWKKFKAKDPRYINASFVAQSQEHFIRMKEEIEAHHAAYQLKLTTFDRKLQRWSDLSKKEKMKRLCGARLPKRARALTNIAYLRIIRSWPKVEKGTQVNHCQFPNPIQDQQTCGCCWAFSICQVIEHQLMVHKNQRMHLSVQQLVDCDTSNEACDGGWPSELTSSSLL
jgi:KDEL-tailed cysteine endopeptidase